MNTTTDPHLRSARMGRRLAVTVLSVALLLGACGGDDDEPDASPTTTEATTTTTEQATTTTEAEVSSPACEAALTEEGQGLTFLSLCDQLEDVAIVLERSGEDSTIPAAAEYVSNGCMMTSTAVTGDWADYSPLCAEAARVLGEG